MYLRAKIVKKRHIPKLKRKSFEQFSLSLKNRGGAAIRSIVHPHYSQEEHLFSQEEHGDEHSRQTAVLPHRMLTIQILKNNDKKLEKVL